MIKAPKVVVRYVQAQKKLELIQFASHQMASSSISRDDVVRVLAEQPGNQDKTPEYLGEKWVVSDHFSLTTVHAHLPDLGITAGKSGESKTTGSIIVDQNVHQVARVEGSFGAAPDFLVLDGQNRVVIARKKGPRATLSAYVGNKILGELKRKDAEYAKEYESLQGDIDAFLNTPSMPGSKLSKLKSYVEKGVLTSEELEDIRKQWRERYKK